MIRFELVPKAAMRKCAASKFLCDLRFCLILSYKIVTLKFVFATCRWRYATKNRARCQARF